MVKKIVEIPKAGTAGEHGKDGSSRSQRATGKILDAARLPKASRSSHTAQETFISPVESRRKLPFLQNLPKPRPIATECATVPNPDSTFFQAFFPFPAQTSSLLGKPLGHAGFRIRRENHSWPETPVPGHGEPPPWPPQPVRLCPLSKTGWPNLNNFAKIPRSEHE